MSTIVELEEELLVRELERRDAARHPANFLRYVDSLDERTGESFRFNMEQPEDDWLQGLIVQRPDEAWNWQRPVIDRLYDQKRLIALKARQLGVTWLGCGFGLWTALYKPGTQAIFYRQKEDDAKELVRRAWYQLKSVPPHLLNGAQVLKPKRSDEPSLEIDLGFPDGSISHIRGMSSAPSSGHGKAVAFALLDEYAYVEAAEGIIVAVSSAVGEDGYLFIISTSNGVSNEQTGEGNAFHSAWIHGEERLLSRLFLKWDLHPARDDEWKATSPEYRNLPEWRRPQQYPETPEEAFGTSEAAYFDGEAMHAYAKLIKEPLFRGDFVPINAREAKFSKREGGSIYVYESPVEEHNYVLGADTATGAGLDFSAACVVDLQTMAIVAEFHGKLDADQYAMQLHYLGKWYGTALIGVEEAGGFGMPVIISLRDGREGRPAYPRMYQHRQDNRPDHPMHKNYGFPMNKATRPEVLEHMEESVREMTLPWMTSGLLYEMQTFVRFNPRKKESQAGTWPRADTGCNDDRVMSTAIALEMYRQRGHYPNRYRRERKQEYTPSFPRQEVEVR